MSFFEDDKYFTGPPISKRMIAAAERTTGYRLPAEYVELLRSQNGGVPRRRCFPTQFASSWAPDHIEIDAILGLGGEWGIDTVDGLGSADQIGEWGYPDIGIVICAMPSGGHDAVMLDYRLCGVAGEPSVCYVDEDREPKQIASTFAEFVGGLEDCGSFGN